MSNKRILKAWFEQVWNKKNEKAIDKFVTGKANREPGALGLDEFKQFFRKTIAAFPDIHFTVEDAIEEKNKVAARVSVRLKSTDKEPRLCGGVYATFASGKIRDAWNWQIFDFRLLRK